ncbi:hypothetical protein BDZ85DRAFT_253958 [Elsinoe ampelina]|uniref:Carboxylesterase family protein n=1 Tax=Elsinoe ampelina TaxID=302913 RepID=A0A6A6GNA7_9PEZI|nr:hypothetical protein BDZ85DRAFT_253958 [Elsinoe ampelina]
MTTRMTRAQAAAMQETQSQEGGLDTSLHEQNSTLSIKGEEKEIATPEGPVDDFRQSTRSTKSKKGSKRGKKNFELASEEMHVDEVATDLQGLSMGSPDLSNLSDFGSSTTNRVPSGGKTPMLVSVDENAEHARPGSPEMDFSTSILKPKSQAKQLLAKEKMGMRSSSNKENVQPGSPAAVVASPATNAVRRDVADNVPIGSPEVEQANEAGGEAAAKADQILEAEAQNTDSHDQSTPILEAAQDESTAVIAASVPTTEMAASNSTNKIRSDAMKSPITNKTETGSAMPTASRTKASVAGANATRKSSANTSRPRIASGELEIPHSKPRPISMSFPTPPPPPKSSKPATKSTFALPGEAVAAKLKAAKEARLARAGSSTAAPSATTTTSRTPSLTSTRPSITKKPVAATQPPVEAKKPAFKARPAPNMSAPSTTVRQTKASQARESLMNGGSISGLKRTTSVREPTKPRASLATSERRASVMPPPKSSLVSGPRPTPAAARARPQSMIVSRPSAVMDPSRRQSVAAPTGAGTTKGKEVFRRAAVEQAEVERKRKEKEESARKAREEAARRGREASKAWAEKRKSKVVEAKQVITSSV